MMRFLKILRILLIVAVVMSLLIVVVAYKKKPETITYGMSFNTPYARELGLDWQVVYDAILGELGVRHLRLAAHWPMIEPVRDQYNFSELDYQVGKAEDVGADVIFAVGRRLPRWPECHIPQWAEGLTWEEQKTEILEQITEVVSRYKDSTAVKIWQVENEPYLSVFATQYCGELDEAFLEEEIALVRELDPSRQILVTDSGNLGTWKGAYTHGDMFGTSVYVYFWNPELGQFKTVLPPWFYRAKEKVVRLFYGKKDTILVELSAEPWLLEPITDVDIETQFSRMNPEKFEDILEYARSTRYDRQYLWGAEWWYWLRADGHAEMWQRGSELFEVQ